LDYLGVIFKLRILGEIGLGIKGRGAVCFGASFVGCRSSKIHARILISQNYSSIYTGFVITVSLQIPQHLISSSKFDILLN
jgi:hypothetical protein